MSSRVRDMTTGSPIRLIFSFSLPLMLGNAFQQIYTMTDAAIVGQFAGQKALAAFGSADWFSWMVFGIATGFSHGFSILIAQRFGAGDMPGLRKSVAMTILFGAISALVLTLISIPLIGPMLHLMRTPDDIFGMAASYLYVMFGGMTVTMAYNVLSSILRALGDGKTPLIAMTIASAVNIGLDLLFVIVFEWGLAGAAGATVIAQGVATLFCLIAMLRVSILRLHREDWGVEKSTVKKLFRLGTPMALQNSIIAFGGMGVQTVINGFGSAFVAGFTATNKLYGLLETACVSYGYAMATYTGQNLGAGRIDRIKQGMRGAVIVATFTAIAVGAAMFIFGESILRLFIPGSDADALRALEVAVRYLKTMCVPLCILYYLHVYRSALQGMGDTVIPMFSGIAELIMRIAVAWGLPLLIGESGVYYAEIAAWAGAAILLVSAYYVRMRKLDRNGISTLKS